MSSKTIVTRLLRIVVSSKRLFLLAFISAILSIIASLSAPIIIGEIIDDFALHGSLKQSIIFLIILTVIYIVFSLSNWIMMYSSNKIAFSSSAMLRKQLYDKMNHFPISFFDSRAQGDLISHYINDIDIISEGLLQGLSTMLSGVISILCCIVIMLYLNVTMALVVIVSAPFTYFVAKNITKRSQAYFQAQATCVGVLNGYSEEMLSSIKTLKAFHYEQTVRSTFHKHNKELYSYGVKSQFFGSLANPSTRFVSNVAYACVGMAGAILALSGHITIGTISIFLLYSGIFSKPFNEITGVITQLQSAIASAQRIFHIMDLQEEKDDSQCIEILETKGHIQFHDVSFYYIEHQPLLQHLNIDIMAGSKVALVGKTGAGKTTFVNLLMRFFDIQSGYIYIDGKNIQEITRDSLRHQFGMVLQDTYLFEDSVLANLMYGNHNITRDGVIEAAKKTGAHHFISHLPKGYDTLLHNNSSSLSQGQRQLLSITRVLILNPSILILDEATSSLDTMSEQHVNEAMNLLMENKTSFIIAHRLSTIMNCDNILVMDQGAIVEQGTHDELLQKKGVYTQLYNSQFA